jgi:hypothetical protein
MMEKLSILLLTTTLLSMTVSQNNLSGTYRSNNEWGGHFLELKSSGTFIQIQSGSVYETKGVMESCKRHFRIINKRTTKYKSERTLDKCE